MMQWRVDHAFRFSLQTPPTEDGSGQPPRI